MNDTIEPVGPSKGLVERAKAMILMPKTEWPVVAAEPASVQGIFLKYVVPLAAIGPIASLIGGQVFGYGAFGFTYRPSLGASLATAITSYVLTLVGVFVVAFVANFLAPKFGGRDNFPAAVKWVAYAYTAAWVAAIFGLVPALGILSILGIWSLYVLYLGASPVMGVAQDKAAAFTAVTVVATIVVYLVIGALAAALTPAWSPAATIASANASGDAGRVEVNVPGYGQLKVTDNGDGHSTVEIPGMGKVEVTEDGDTVKIDGENFNAEVQNSAATAE